jgi:hypothetical protein
LNVAGRLEEITDVYIDNAVGPPDKSSLRLINGIKNEIRLIVPGK